MIDTVYTSKQAKDQLIKLKRVTGIKNWNVLCRWAFCLSIRNDSNLTLDNNRIQGGGVEMSWKTFAGEYAEIFSEFLNQKYDSQSKLQNAVCGHIDRGIIELVSKIKSIQDLAFLVTSEANCSGDR